MPVHPITFNFRTESEVKYHPKSANFRAIQTALDNYVANSTPANLRALERALIIWKNSKGNWRTTIRYDAVQHLTDWLALEIPDNPWWPAAEAGWGAAHNCYAYAMKCQNGGLNNARPGRLDNNPRAQKTDDFAQGVVDDAYHQGAMVYILRRQIPRPIPAPSHGGYLVAMISMTMGYHFLRRDEVTRLWSHKNGSINDVETFYYNPNDHNVRDPIDDAGLLKIVTDRGINGSMDFDAFLEVPPGGITVA
ncbi:MAG: hypothetical protein JST93_32015 [Acidobacteria bacterium]|nr:hypothetical protein [Acidobacteriota bacterium]